MVFFIATNRKAYFCLGSVCCENPQTTFSTVCSFNLMSPHTSVFQASQWWCPQVFMDGNGGVSSGPIVELSLTHPNPEVELSSPRRVCCWASRFLFRIWGCNVFWVHWQPSLSQFRNNRLVAFVKNCSFLVSAAVEQCSDEPSCSSGKQFPFSEGSEEIGELVNVIQHCLCCLKDGPNGGGGKMISSTVFILCPIQVRCRLSGMSCMARACRTAKALEIYRLLDWLQVPATEPCLFKEV